MSTERRQLHSFRRWEAKGKQKLAWPGCKKLIPKSVMGKAGNNWNNTGGTQRAQGEEA